MPPMGVSKSGDSYERQHPVLNHEVGLVVHRPESTLLPPPQGPPPCTSPPGPSHSRRTRLTSSPLTSGGSSASVTVMVTSMEAESLKESVAVTVTM